MFVELAIASLWLIITLTCQQVINVKTVLLQSVQRLCHILRSNSVSVSSLLSVTTSLENLEMSAILTAVREMSLTSTPLHCLIA